MADDTLKPMTVEDIAAATGDTPEPSEPLKNTTGNPATGEVPVAGGADAEGGTGDHEPRPPKQVIADNAAKLRSEASERARAIAEEGKNRATDALEHLSRLLNDAAGQVDEKLGGQYGQYARTAADRVQSFSSSLNDRTVDDLLDDARDLVRKSPAVAIGTAAALGFVVARLISAGLEQRDQA